MPNDEGNRSTDGARAQLEALTPRLYGWVKMRLWSRTQIDPDDIVQETLCRAIIRLDRFQGGSLRAWAFQIASNVILEAMRQLRRTPRQFVPAPDSSRSPLDEIAATATTLTRAVARRDDVRRLLEQARSLDETDQQVLMLCGLRGLGAEDAAEALGMQKAALQKRWYRLRQRLRDIPWIANELETPSD